MVCEPPFVKEVYEWKVGNWDKCSKKCGGGTRTRALQCTELSITTKARTTLDDKLCEQMGLEQPSITASCNPASCGAKVGFASLRLRVKSFQDLVASSTLHGQFVANCRVSIARSLKIMLSRVTITSLGTTKATKLRRRLASTDQDEVAVNFEVAPPASGATAKTVEDCMTDLAAQASEPTSALLTDSFLSEHVTASSTAADGTTVAPPSFLAVSVVEAGKQSDDQFETLQAQITPTAETAASNAGGDSSPIGIIVGAIAGVLALSAVAIVLVRRNKQVRTNVQSNISHITCPLHQFFFPSPCMLSN